MEPARTLARRFWAATEPLHALSYFDPLALAPLRDVGLRGFWMGYFAGRVAPLGALTAEPVTAMAFGFAPARVARAIPDAWRYASVSDVLNAHVAGATAALDAQLRDRFPARDLEQLADLLTDAAHACRFDGRPLAAGWSALPLPDDPVARIWSTATVLREHRGDGHVLAAVSLGLHGIDAVTTHVATGAVTREVLQSTRGWTDDEWSQSIRRLQARGIVDRDGRLTKRGGALRHELEAITDRLAAAPVERLGADGIEAAIALATPMSRHLFDTGAIPDPNPVGVPRW